MRIGIYAPTSGGTITPMGDFAHVAQAISVRTGAIRGFSNRFEPLTMTLVKVCIDFGRPSAIACTTVTDGGECFYVQGDHRDTIPSLWHGLTCEPNGGDSASVTAPPLKDSDDESRVSGS